MSCRERMRRTSGRSVGSIESEDRRVGLCRAMKALEGDLVSLNRSRLPFRHCADRPHLLDATKANLKNGLTFTKHFGRNVKPIKLAQYTKDG